VSLFILFVLVTGGGEYQIGAGLRISARHIVNPLAVLAFFFLFRLFFLTQIPFFNIPSLNLDCLAGRLRKAKEKLVETISGLDPRAVKRIVIWTIGLSVLLKMAIAFTSFGFFSGDDVEIHEMTFARLFQWNWQAWGLRNPLFPMVFIYPIQFVLKFVGIETAWPLIYAGRLVVIAFSALNLWLVFRVATRLFNNQAVGLASLFFLALSKLHTTFASTELPRTVASTFILLGFWFLLSKTKGARPIILSGVFLGLAASLRFSEIIYIVPAFLFCFLGKERSRAFGLAVVAVATFVLAIGLSDAVYWKSPFYSLVNIIDYTLVNKLSSRGYEPFYYYLSNAGLWTDFLTFGLAVYALKLKNNKIFLWAFAPIVLLSFLPHKEPRYLVPVIPFWAIMAGFSAWHLLGSGRKTIGDVKVSAWQKRILLFLGCLVISLLVLAHKDPRYSILALPFLALIACILYVGNKFALWKGRIRTDILSPPQYIFLVFSIISLALITEIDGFRFAKSESGVEMARYLAQRSDIKILAIEDSWRAGGRLYFGKNTDLIDFDSTYLANPDLLKRMILEKKPWAIGVRNEHFRGSDCAALLESMGFQETRFSNKKRKDTYRLFLQNRKSS